LLREESGARVWLSGAPRPPIPEGITLEKPSLDRLPTKTWSHAERPLKRELADEVRQASCAPAARRTCGRAFFRGPLGRQAVAGVLASEAKYVPPAAH
jgi:hypothetical protein